MSGNRLCFSRYRFVGPFYSESLCRIDIFAIDTTHPIVVLTELKDNPGTSVTNAFERLATEIYSRYLHPLGIERGDVTWLEHVERKCGFRETWDEVSLTYEEESGVFSTPKWIRSTEPAFWSEVTN